MLAGGVLMVALRLTLFVYTTVANGLPGDHGPTPTKGQVEQAMKPRHYTKVSGAAMTLTIKSIGLYDAPVFNSDSFFALARRISHVPETSMPWDKGPHPNVYLQGHRFGYPGTRSRLIFYRLDELRPGDEIELRGHGKTYEYRVLTSFVVDPSDSWVMGQIKGRDMLSLQTCTPVPGLDKRLIVRAERV